MSKKKKQKTEIILNASRYARPIPGSKNGTRYISFTKTEIKRILNVGK